MITRTTKAFSTIAVLTLAAGAAFAGPCGSADKAAKSGCGDSYAKADKACDWSNEGAGAAMATVVLRGEKNIVETAVAAGQFNTLAAALKAAGLVDTLAGEGPFTVFAPTDAAFAKLPAGTVENLLKPENRDTLRSILLYHVAAGEVLAKDVVGLKNAGTVNGQRIDIAADAKGVRLDGSSNVVQTDIVTSNGVIHVIDTVLMPETKDIVDVADAAGSFGTLLAAAKAAGLVDALKGDGPITVFAPTDEAFAKLGQKTIQDLLKPENKDKLAGILTYHVVAGRVYSDQAVALAADGATPTTLNGQTLALKAYDGGLKINKSKVVAADIEASNGVIHVIDTVLMPH
jgi:uncharacterized surface protein with fasciclin (FAS1) repeats